MADRCWFLGATAIGETALGLEVGFPTGTDADAAVAALRARWPDLDVAAVDPTAALDAALDAWRTHARPVRAGRLHVRYPWLAADDDPPAVGERVVVLDPGRAFGSGSHPSTLACLAAVDRWAGPGTSVLDVGCGSGVLAVAAAVLGAGPVAAYDVDPVAEAATAANAAANGVAVAVGEPSPGLFDLVLANIGLATLVALAPALAARVAPGGRLVLSGLLAAQADAAVAAQPSLREVERGDGEWCTVVLAHPPER